MQCIIIGRFVRSLIMLTDLNEVQTECWRRISILHYTDLKQYS